MGATIRCLMPGFEPPRGACLLGAVASCLSPDPPAESQWPPADFYLEVRRTEYDRETHRVRFFADGLVVYGEAVDWLGGPRVGAEWLPVFGRISAYRMRPKSVRQLSRLLDRAGLHDLPADQVDDRDPRSPMAAIHWRGFQRDGIVWAQGDLEVGAARVLHIVNSYLPEAHELEMPGLTGDPEPRHLVPSPMAPAESVDGALDFYLSDLLIRAPENFDFLVDAFALAVVGRRSIAEDLLRRLEATGVPAARGVWTLPGEEEADPLAEYRRVLAAPGN